MKMKRMTATATIIALTLTIQASLPVIMADQAGTSTSPSTHDNAVSTKYMINKDRAQHVYNTFVKQVQQPNHLKQSHDFMKSHIYEVTPYQATLMTLRLENALQAQWQKWSDQFFADSIQNKLVKIYIPKDTLSTLIARTTNQELRNFLQGALDSGYKLETAEGMFFPEIDYERFAKYRPYVMNDIKTYIDIMAVESANPPAKDAALVISWEEITKRALSQEAFVQAHPNSNRTIQIDNLYQSYVINTAYGLNNTPLFDYDSHVMDAKAKDTYLSLLANSDIGNSGYLKKLQSFMDVLKSNNYKLNDSVQKHLKEHYPFS
ncbi:hypothetical protein [Paenibacillus sp. CMAA1364]